MFRKSLITVAVLAISPAIAFATPVKNATATAKPAFTQLVKVEKAKVPKTHHTANKMKVTTHIHLKAKPKVNKV